MAGLLGTLFAHLWLYFLLSNGFLKTEPVETVDPYREFSIELDNPDPEEEEDQSYTETNPDVPENEPDQTNRFGARSQQAANEEVPEEIDPANRPAVESADLVETDQVLTGSLSEPLPAPLPARESADEAQEEQNQEAQPPSPEQPQLVAVVSGAQAQRKEIPLFGSQEEAEDESGIADYDYAKLDEAPTNVIDLIEGEAEEGEAEETVEDSPELPGSVAIVSMEAVDPLEGVPAPRARPQLPRLPASPRRNSNLGVSNVGNLAVDAKASKFGEYMERLIETVSLNWNDLVDRSSSVERKSVVKIRFMLTSDGFVSDIEILEGTTSRAIGIYMCRQAIERGIPYGPWPAGLVDMFGEEEDVTFTFHYY